MTRFVLIGIAFLMAGVMVSYAFTHSPQPQAASVDNSAHGNIAPMNTSMETQTHGSWMQQLGNGWHRMLGMFSGSQGMASMNRSGFGNRAGQSGMTQHPAMMEHQGWNDAQSDPMMDTHMMDAHRMGDSGAMMGSGNAHPMGNGSSMNGSGMNGSSMNGSGMNGSSMNGSGMGGSGRMNDGVLDALGSLFGAFTNGHGSGHGMM